MGSENQNRRRISEGETTMSTDERNAGSVLKKENLKKSNDYCSSVEEEYSSTSNVYANPNEFQYSSNKGVNADSQTPFHVIDSNSYNIYNTVSCATTISGHLIPEEFTTSIVHPPPSHQSQEKTYPHLLFQVADRMMIPNHQVKEIDEMKFNYRANNNIIQSNSSGGSFPVTANADYQHRNSLPNSSAFNPFHNNLNTTSNNQYSLPPPHTPYALQAHPIPLQGVQTSSTFVNSFTQQARRSDMIYPHNLSMNASYFCQLNTPFINYENSATPLVSPQHSATATTITANSFAQPLPIPSPASLSASTVSLSKQNSFALIRSFMKKKQEAHPSNENSDETSLLKTAVIQGYLLKLTRNGVWQRRYFVVDGVNLMYYKTHKRIKLLATLDLVSVGAIMVDNMDLEECTFTIQVSGRLYYLKAQDSATCKDWVILLNRVREARNGIGGLKLSSSTIKDTTTNKQDCSSDDFTPIIVQAIPRRPRLHNTNSMENDETDQSYIPPSVLEDDSNAYISPTSSTCSPPPTFCDIHPISLPEPKSLVLARWQKRRTRLQSMRKRIFSFIRWLKRSNTTIENFPTPTTLKNFPLSYVEDGATAAETTIFSVSTTPLGPHSPKLSKLTPFANNAHQTEFAQSTPSHHVKTTNILPTDPRMLS